MGEIRAISIREPWAGAIVDPDIGKDVENRSRPTTYRGVVLIQAGLKYQQQTMHEGCLQHSASLVSLISGVPLHEVDERCEPLGKLIGIAELYDCVTPYAACDGPGQLGDSGVIYPASAWFTGPYGWLLRHARPFTHPVPWTGMLGLPRVHSSAIRVSGVWPEIAEWASEYDFRCYTAERVDGCVVDLEFAAWERVAVGAGERP